MTDQEIISFIENNNVRIGDTLLIQYKRFYFETVKAKIVSKSLATGSGIVKTPLGPLNLPENKNYLLLYDSINKLFGITSKYIMDLEIYCRRAYNVSDYTNFIEQNKISNGDTLTIVNVDTSLFQCKLIDYSVRLDNENYPYFLAEINNLTRKIYIHNISEANKVK